jgi:hypothetical protein
MKPSRGAVAGQNYLLHFIVPPNIQITDYIIKRCDGFFKNDFFRKQQEYLEALNIREAVEMEIADIQAKFGSKYDDAIREVRKYITKLEKQLKNHNGGINEKANS